MQRGLLVYGAALAAITVVAIAGIVFTFSYDEWLIESVGYAPGAFILMSAGVFAAVFATVWVGDASAENRDHVPPARTKSASLRHGLPQRFAGDTACIVAATAVAGVFVGIVVAAAYTHNFGWNAGRSFLFADSRAVWPANAVVSVLLPLAWFGIIVAFRSPPFGRSRAW